MTSSRRARRLLLFVLGAALVVAPGAAHADEPDSSVEAHIQRGIELRKDGRDRDALAEFEAAYAVRAAPRTGAQIALAHQALGEWLEAERGLNATLEAASDPWVVQYRPVLESALTVVRGHLGWLDVETNVEGAELILDGQSVGALRRPESIRVPAGHVGIEVRAAGYAAVRQTTLVTPNMHTHEQVTLARELPARVDAPAPTEVPSPAWIAPPLTSSPATTGGGRITAGALTLAGGGVLAIAGVVAWRLRINDIDTYNDDSQCVQGTLSRAQRCGGYASSEATALGFEVGFFAAAGVAAISGASLLLTANTKRSRVACAPSLPGGVFCRGYF